MFHAQLKAYVAKNTPRMDRPERPEKLRFDSARDRFYFNLKYAGVPKDEIPTSVSDDEEEGVITAEAIN